MSARAMDPTTAAVLEPLAGFQGLGFRVWGLGFGVGGSGVRIRDLRFVVWGFRFRV